MFCENEKIDGVNIMKINIKQIGSAFILCLTSFVQNCVELHILSPAHHPVTGNFVAFVRILQSHIHQGSPHDFFKEHIYTRRVMHT